MTTATSERTPTRQHAEGAWRLGRHHLQNDVTAGRRIQYEQVGVYFNYVGQADLQYGGGNVPVDSFSRSWTRFT